MSKLVLSDWWVTEEKVLEAIRRILSVADPVAIVAFGSRARRTHRPDSDLDLAVVLDVDEREVHRIIPYENFSGLRMPVDLLPMTKQRYDEMRPWVNTVQQRIAKEGVTLYERGGQPASADIVHQIC